MFFKLISTRWCALSLVEICLFVYLCFICCVIIFSMFIAIYVSGVVKSGTDLRKWEILRIFEFFNQFIWLNYINLAFLKQFSSKIERIRKEVGEVIFFLNLICFWEKILYPCLSGIHSTFYWLSWTLLILVSITANR